MKKQSKYIQQQDLLAYAESLVGLLKSGEILRNDVKTEFNKLGYSLMFYASTLAKAGSFLAGEGRKLQHKTPAQLELSPELIEALDNVQAFIKKNRSEELQERKKSFSKKQKPVDEFEKINICTLRNDISNLAEDNTCYLLR